MKNVTDSCERCGRSVSTPVRLTDLSRRPVEETYYACPFCFSRLNIEDVAEHFEHSHGREKSGKSDKRQVAVVASNCLHEFGYLRSRPKDSGIPDECLTCSRILQCMSSSL